MTTADSTHLKAARAHERMKSIRRHSAERPWTTWIVALVLISPIILLIALSIIGFS